MKKKTFLYMVVFKISYHVTFVYYIIKGIIERATKDVTDED